MKTSYLFVLVVLLSAGCREKTSSVAETEQKVEFNAALAEELAKMAEVDQIAAFFPQGKYQEMSKEQWEAFQDSVFTTHKARISEIFAEYGFPGYNLVGEKGSKNFWLMVQHADDTPEFQKEVLEKMKVEVDKENADPSNYGYLVDRVKINTGEAQVYGTQVAYNTQICQAYPKELTDSANVNERRKSIGLPSIEEYLNGITQMHFDMNKERYVSKGITEPKLYTVQ